jgi:hypothetical protein
VISTEKCGASGRLRSAQREVAILLDAKLCVNILHACTYVDKTRLETRKYGTSMFTKNPDNCVKANGTNQPPRRLLTPLRGRIRLTQ